MCLEVARFGTVWTPMSKYIWPPARVTLKESSSLVDVAFEEVHSSSILVIVVPLCRSPWAKRKPG